jgi:hypothetical protein
MTGKQNQNQGEIQLVAEWIQTLPATWPTVTRIKVGEQMLRYAGQPLTPAQQRAFSVWSDYADARVATPHEVWIVEGKLVGTADAYGQVLDYTQQYFLSADYERFKPRPIVPIVLTMGSRPRTASYFSQFGVRTIVFAPSFPFERALQKLFPSAQILAADTNNVPDLPT